MSHALHVAQVNPVHNFTWTGISGWDSQEAFMDFLNIFEVALGMTNEYGPNDDFEILREDVKRAAGELALHSGRCKENEEDIEAALNAMGMTEEEMISALMRLVQQSDQSNEWILVSWW